MRNKAVPKKVIVLCGRATILSDIHFRTRKNGRISAREYRSLFRARSAIPRGQQTARWCFGSPRPFCWQPKNLKYEGEKENCCGTDSSRVSVSAPRQSKYTKRYRITTGPEVRMEAVAGNGELRYASTIDNEPNTVSIVLPKSSSDREDDSKCVTKVTNELPDQQVQASPRLQTPDKTVSDFLVGEDGRPLSASPVSTILFPSPSFFVQSSAGGEALHHKPPRVSSKRTKVGKKTHSTQV